MFEFAFAVAFELVSGELEGSWKAVELRQSIDRNLACRSANCVQLLDGVRSGKELPLVVSKAPYLGAKWNEAQPSR